MKHRTACLVLGAALALFTGGARAEEAPALAPADQVGKWSFSMNEPGADLKKISNPRQKKITGELQGLSRLITATPVMNPPKGFEARFWGSMTAKDRFDICSGKKCPPSRPTAVLAMMIGRYEDRGGKRKAAFNSPATMDISFNNIGHVFANLPVLFKDADGFLLPEPVRDGERAGMPAYLNKGHAVAVLAGNDRPLWLPVSRERYLKAAVAAAAKEAGIPLTPPKPQKKKGKQKPGEKQGEEKTGGGLPILVEEGRSWIDPAQEKEWVEQSRSLAGRIKESGEVLQERLQKLQADLAALTPQERTLPARVDLAAAADGQSPPLLPVESTSGVAVVTPNFGFFNAKLPPEKLQLLVVQWKFDGNTLYDPDRSDISDTLNNRALREIYRTMDWNGLRAKVIQTAP